MKNAEKEIKNILNSIQYSKYSNFCISEYSLVARCGWTSQKFELKKNVSYIFVLVYFKNQ